MWSFAFQTISLESWKICVTLEDEEKAVFIYPRLNDLVLLCSLLESCSVAEEISEDVPFSYLELLLQFQNSLQGQSGMV